MLKAVSSAHTNTIEGGVNLDIAVWVGSPCLRLYITAAITINMQLSKGGFDLQTTHTAVTTRQLPSHSLQKYPTKTLKTAQITAANETTHHKC